MLADIRYERSIEGVDFQEVAQLLHSVGLADFDAKARERAFAGSDVVLFVYRGQRLVGCGRALSDGAYEAALYDVAVAPDLQGHGLGREIVNLILAELPGQNVIFFASVGKEPFYEKLGCTRMKTGMARFARPERMRLRGYID
ncbi:MAG: GNAT family N-acetyltransferase [Coriobacteriales bacterium]|jgi:ribosomal protein S18 acetylase RimI-like enzyme|nr:GNAT family N-acetyltransferase [Coriobacteriales bacterium]